MTTEYFVSADEAAKFLGINRRFLLSLARLGIDGAYPLGTGQERRTWVFRMSELAEAIKRRKRSDQEKTNNPDTRSPTRVTI